MEPRNPVKSDRRPLKVAEEDIDDDPPCLKYPKVEKGVEFLAQGVAALKNELREEIKTDLKEEMDKLRVDILKEISTALHKSHHEAEGFPLLPRAVSTTLSESDQFKDAAHESGNSFQWASDFTDASSSTSNNLIVDTSASSEDLHQEIGSDQKLSYFAIVSSFYAHPLEESFLRLLEREEECLIRIDDDKPIPLFQKENTKTHVGLGYWIDSTNWKMLLDRTSDTWFIRRLCKYLVGIDAMKYTAAGRGRFIENDNGKEAFPPEVTALIKYHFRARLIKRHPTESKLPFIKNLSTEEFVRKYKETSAEMDKWCNTTNGVPCRNFRRGQIGAMMNAISIETAYKERKLNELREKVRKRFGDKVETDPTPC
ncbi:Hypothetical predicted protein [Cloeon dipterum]|uniref:Uncharacterized protein n=1 Tax=Cloeon dipterum TaxID=197152 RepID=A0A8S1E386_9INSE|nr:Hypothetical predicted protein [Cloeon dipterum]